MKLPAKIEYAYKAILELAIHYQGKNPVQLSKICRSQHIPKKYLVQILLRLKDAGILQTSRGMSGGYYLARDPSKITLADVFRAVDSHVLNSAVVPTGRLDSDEVIHKVWDDINRHIAVKLEIDFENLVTRLQSTQLNYHI